MRALLQLTDYNSAVVLAPIGPWLEVKPATHPFLVPRQFQATQIVGAAQCLGQ